MNNLKLRGGIMLGAVALSTLLVLVKAVKLVIPVLGGALTAFAILTVKAYVAKKTVDGLEKAEKKVKQ